ncbi:MAG: hypothetical protein RIC14_05660 [Filomicrobium sp.]
MRITPLVQHARLYLPTQTDLFADSLGVSSIDVVSGGTTTITTSSPHGFTLNSEIGITITDAETPNPITAAEVVSSTEIKLTTQHPHDLSTTPDATRFKAWHTNAKLDGFGSPLLDGSKQLLSVHSDTQFAIVPSAEVGSITLEGGEVLLERLERELVGWKKVTAATATTLTFATPASVARSYTVTSPSVVQNFRILGAASLEDAVRLFVRSDTESTPADAVTMFIVPVDVRSNRSRAAKTDMLQEIGPGDDYRQLLIDGFEVLVVIPVEHSRGKVAAVDKCHGEIWKAVMRTFQGLRLPQPEFCEKGSYVATMESHGTARSDNANYYHRYKFQVPVYITNPDAIAPYDWSDIPVGDIEAGTLTGPTLAPYGSVSGGQIEIKDEGLFLFGKPSPLTTTIKLDEPAE